MRVLSAPSNQSDPGEAAFQKALLLHFDKYYVRIPRTPVPYLFKTNDIPSSEDVAKMRAYIQRLQQITISTETSPLSIKRYKGNRAYGIAVEHTRLQQTTIRNLPPEIIQQIVHFSLSPSPTLVREDCLPWVASWVCSSWRRTVLTQHHLWGTLPPIRLQISAAKPGRKRKEFLQELLRRSGDAPLTLSIIITIPDLIHRDHYDHTLLNLLLEHSNRYVDVRFHLNDHVFSSIVMPTSSRWRRLRHLSLETDWFYQNSYPRDPRFDLRQITSLRSINIPSNLWSQFLLPHQMETATLYSMGVTSLSPADLVLTLDLRTKNLVSSVTKLVLPACMRGLGLGDEFSRLSAPQVTEIVIYDPSSSWSTGGPMTLECFVTPCLHTLKISFPSTLTIDRLASRLSEATSLATLHLLCRPDSVPTRSPDDVRISMSTLTTLLESTPNVVNFKIFDDTSSYSFIHLLAYLKKPRKDWDSDPLPRLKHLTIFVRWDIPPHVLDLLHYVAISRVERPPPFGENHFDRLETFEVVLNHADDFVHTRPTNASSRTTKRMDEGRALAPHAAQDFVRGVMEGWTDFRGLGRSTSHPSLVGVAEEIRDVHERLERLLYSVDEAPRKVFADMERCLESMLEGFDPDTSLGWPIEYVYVRHFFASLNLVGHGLLKTVTIAVIWCLLGVA